MAMSSKQIDINFVVHDLQNILAQRQAGMRKARAVFAGVAPIVPKARENALLVLVITHRPAEMTADVAQRFDLAFVFIEQNIVALHPTRELARLLQFRDRREIGVFYVASLLLHSDSVCLCCHMILTRSEE